MGLDRLFVIALSQMVFGIFLTPCIYAQVTNQNLYDTIPNLPAHYEKRLAEFKSEPVETGKVIFLGNSITEGGAWADLTGNKNILNRGIGGDVTFGVINRLNDIIIRKPSKIFILIGINDISKDFPDEVIANNYKKIIEELKAKTPTSKLYVQSILPLNPEYPRFPQHFNKEEHVIIVNKLLKDLCVSQHVTFINLYPVFLNSQHRLDPSLTSDGLHLNNAGYQVWVKFLMENGYL